MAGKKVKVAAAQLGPIQLNTPRQEVLERMLKQLSEARDQNVKLLVFPELALTTFFPRHIIEDAEQLAMFFENESVQNPHAILESANAKPLFEKATEYNIDIAFGYAERWTDRRGTSTDYNTMIYFSASTRKILSKYRKVHLPGTERPIDKPDWDQQLEKMYFTPGDLGFPAFRAPDLVEGARDAEEFEGKGAVILGMMLCNDRRWPEAWRCYGLQGVEIILQGYNTTAYARQLPGNKDQQEDLAVFHHRLSCQAGSYQNACFSINPGKAGIEDGGALIASSMIVGPDGRIIAESQTKGDELIVAEIDLDQCRDGKTRVFAFDRHRRIEHYSRITEQVGVIEPPSWA